MSRQVSRWVSRAAVLGGFVGLLIGAAVGGALHEPLTGGNEGNPAEGLDWIVGGAFVGALVGASATGMWALHAVRSARGWATLGAVLGAIALGTAGGLAAFAEAAPEWPLPVAAASLVGGGLGWLLGRAVASGGPTEPLEPRAGGRRNHG